MVEKHFGDYLGYSKFQWIRRKMATREVANLINAKIEEERRWLKRHRDMAHMILDELEKQNYINAYQITNNLTHLLMYEEELADQYGWGTWLNNGLDYIGRKTDGRQDF